ncbi:MAG: hypothetical protein OXH99_12670 [Bryobacterales bacterium]|nr:hypothetical protein [Bryobacterales bacterium]
MGAQAAQVGVLAMEGEGRLIAGEVGVVAAQQGGGSEVCEPGRRRAAPAVETTRLSGGSPVVGRATAERASTALSTSRTAAVGSLPVLSQKPPRARREPGARPLKAAPPGNPRVPTSSAPAGVLRRSRHRKTALRRRSA